MEDGPLAAFIRGAGESGPEPGDGTMAGTVRGAPFLRCLHRSRSDSMAVPQSVSGGVSPREQREVCAALLRINGSRFDLLRGIMVCMRSVFSECMGISYPECRNELHGAESMLLCFLRTQPPIEG